ncbi:MAG: hypothetical protein WCH20_08715 [Nitrospira sp.]
MKSFKQFIRESYPPLYEDAILMTLRDFIDRLEVFNAQKTNVERIVEIREDCPEPGTYAIRLLVRDQEEEAED